MDHLWSPVSTWPAKLYRIHRPFQEVQPKAEYGLRAKSQLYLRFNEHLPLFLQSITDHRENVPIPSPWISTFADEAEAHMWALAAEKTWHKTCFVLEINPAMLMEHHNIFKVADIQDKSGEQLGLNGIRNSEWLIPIVVPPKAIKREFKSTKDIVAEIVRREQEDHHMNALRSVPEYDWLGPNRSGSNYGFLSAPDEPKDIVKVPQYTEGLLDDPNVKELACGCSGERYCIHFKWPTAEDNEIMGVDKL